MSLGSSGSGLKVVSSMEVLWIRVACFIEIGLEACSGFKSKASIVYLVLGV